MAQTPVYNQGKERISKSGISKFCLHFLAVSLLVSYEPILSSQECQLSMRIEWHSGWHDTNKEEYDLEACNRKRH